MSRATAPPDAHAVRPLEGREVLVVGLGVSGAAAATAARAAGAHVTVREAADTPLLRARAEPLRGAGVHVHLGDTSARPGAVDVVVPSPGIPEHHPVLAEATRSAIPVWSEPELAWRLNGGRTRLVGVTGTNGKTTTTEVLGACLGAPTGGNIGEPLARLLAAPQAPPLVVAELSSFQLRFCHQLRPDVAVLLNVAPDHLDWHGSLAAYAAAKARIWRIQGDDDWVVLNHDDEGATALAASHPPPGRVAACTTGEPEDGQVGVEDGWVRARLDGRDDRIVAVDTLPLAAPHDLANLLAAATAALCAGAEPEALARALRGFERGPHRLEAVATVGGVGFVDDSKATNPHAAAAALAAFPSVVWIAGGLNKGLALEPLVDVARGRVRAAVTIGTSGPEIAAALRGAGVEVVEAGNLRDAVPVAAGLARSGDTVLLAPACASMDQFVNYAERGEVFREAVGRIAAQGGGRATPSAS